MLATMLYAPGDVRVEERDEPEILKAHRRHHPAVGDLHLRLGPLAVTGASTTSRHRWRWAMNIAASLSRSAAM